MAIRTRDELLHGAEAVWRLDDAGRPHVALSRMGPMLRERDGPFSHRFAAEDRVASPEELLAAAQVTCYASSITSVLRNQGLTIREVVLRAVSVVRPEPEGGPGLGWRVDELVLELVVDGELSEAELADAGRVADLVCPISKAVAGAVPFHRRGVLGKVSG